jgi:hypothetical protein
MLIAAAYLVALGVLPAPLCAGNKLELKLRIYEGSRAASPGPSQLNPSFSIQRTVFAYLPAGLDLDDEKGRIKRVFNLHGVSLIEEAGLIIGEGGQEPDRVRHAFRMDGNAYQVLLMVTEFTLPVRLFTVLQVLEEEKFKNMSGELVEMKGVHSAVFGFETRQGKPYFLSIRVTGPEEMVTHSVPPPSPPPPMPREKQAEIEEFEKGAYKVTWESAPPRLLKQVDPVLPPGAPAPAAGDHVSLNLRIDKLGNVTRVMIIYSSIKAIEKPAVDAVKQWKYAPYIRDGKPREAVLSATVRFYSR